MLGKNDKDGQEQRAAEIRRLFAELEETYARIAAAPTDATESIVGMVGDDGRKASALIQRIRELQGL